ncbi:MAG: single-stranded DNA-binding protein [Chloroflexi bacterium]|nr:MAG: single-stranded DNA-binding protein [Chloroflexota bacterium]RLC83280.1 MAG: single-stranded DNA-binding protein [Chloroflexota bacterium]
MARGLNKVMVIGHVGRDPEMRYMPSGRPVTSFSVATTRSWTNAEGERREETEWFNVVAWGNLAEICKQHLRKGQQVYIEGRLQTRSWEDQEGRKRFRTELVANEMILLGSRRGASSEAIEATAGSGEEFPF